MERRASIRPCPETRGAPKVEMRAVSAPRTPRQNRILAALPLENYERLLPDLEPVPLPLGSTVHSAGERENYLYFPAAGIVSRSYETEKGESAEFAVTGNEGVIGIPTFLGGESMPSQAVVLSAGYGFRLKAAALRRGIEHDSTLLHLLLRYTQVLITQTGLSAACNRHHSLEQQLCRLVLSSLDRLSSNTLSFTQELIASLLGVRRESVTEAAGQLQSAGLIRYNRGRITVLDRPQLEARACECYSVERKELARLFPDSLAN